MDAIEYIKEAKRLCKSRHVCKSVYDKCPLQDENGHCTANIWIADTIEGVEETVQIVEQWAKDNPVKTRQSEFLKMFPNAEMSDGAIGICPKKVDKKYCCASIPCGECYRKFWLTELTDND